MPFIQLFSVALRSIQTTFYKNLHSRLISSEVYVIWLYTGVKFNELNLLVRTQNQINIFMTVCLILVVMISIWSVLSL